MASCYTNSTQYNVSMNCSHAPSLNMEPYMTWAQIICYTLFTLILFLNLLVIYTLVIKEKKKSRLFFFILHLAIADSLVGVCVLGDGIVTSHKGAWYGGDFLCRMWRYVKIVGVIASNNLLIGMSLDRFLAVKSPLNFVKIGSILDKALVLGAWMLSTSISLPFIFYAKNRTYGGGCNLELPRAWWKPYVITVTCATFLLPAVAITVCYTGICIVVWKKWRKGLKLSEISSEVYVSKDRLNCKQRKSSGLLPRAKIKSIKLTLVVCIAFFLCWTPYFVFTLLDVFQANVIEHRLYSVLGMLYPINSVCNPVLFIIFNTKMFVPKKRATSSTCMTYDGLGTQITAT